MEVPHEREIVVFNEQGDNIVVLSDLDTVAVEQQSTEQNEILGNDVEFVGEQSAVNGNQE